ncbi:DUF190 domain-containing protein [Legionella cardiaca]|uniref:DUF190 domain-containing protein n=1 Tax=Legionella cardiaca TaxID=1071983 RepID=A0ABY8AVK1_9GAMM|nr:DUF190 domain-containing protein [Legionella cardiaca]WED43446.1 DUF190 domain-containing protein [Legionella cardiaca]
MTQVKIVRIYLSEDSPVMNEIYNFLHQQKIKGATIFRGVKGYSSSGEREASILDLHFDLPMILEFFDEVAKVDKIMVALADKIQAGRILSWLADLT